MPKNNRGHYEALESGVASVEVTLTTEASVRIKALIARAHAENLSKKFLEAEIKKIIRETTGQMTNALKPIVRAALQSMAQRDHFTLTRNLEIINNAFIKADHKFAMLLVDESGEVARSNVLLSQEKIRNRNVALRIAAPLIENYQKKVDLAMKTLSAEQPLSRRVDTETGKTSVNSLRNTAEMMVRAEKSEADRKEFIAEYDLFWFSSHANCSIRCEPYQGQLASVDSLLIGTKIEGHIVIDANEAWNGPEGNGNGITTGYNCRHHMIPWTPGSKAPVDYTKEEIKRERDLDRMQRTYENNIRQKKAEEVLRRAMGDKEEAKKLNRQWHRMELDYRIKSLENHRPADIWRTRLSLHERSLLGIPGGGEGSGFSNNSAGSDSDNDSDNLMLLTSGFAAIGAPPGDNRIRSEVEKIINDTRLTKDEMYEASANVIVNLARLNEPQITKTVTDAVSNSNGIMFGLDHRLKTHASLERKLWTDTKGEINKLPDVTAGIKDALRYTAVGTPDTLSAMTIDIARSIVASGGTIIKYKDTFEKDAIYMGTNIGFTDKSGQRAEIQTHTFDSVNVKEGFMYENGKWVKDESVKAPSHDYYEEWRSKDTPLERKHELEVIMADLFSRVRIPKDMDIAKEYIDNLANK